MRAFRRARSIRFGHYAPRGNFRSRKRQIQFRFAAHFHNQVSDSASRSRKRNSPKRQQRSVGRNHGFIHQLTEFQFRKLAQTVFGAPRLLFFCGVVEGNIFIGSRSGSRSDGSIADSTHARERRRKIGNLHKKASIS